MCLKFGHNGTFTLVVDFNAGNEKLKLCLAELIFPFVRVRSVHSQIFMHFSGIKIIINNSLRPPRCCNVLGNILGSLGSGLEGVLLGRCGEIYFLMQVSFKSYDLSEKCGSSEEVWGFYYCTIRTHLCAALPYSPVEVTAGA